MLACTSSQQLSRLQYLGVEAAHTLHLSSPEDMGQVSKLSGPTCMGLELVMWLKVGGQPSAAQHPPDIACACMAQRSIWLKENTSTIKDK